MIDLFEPAEAMARILIVDDSAAILASLRAMLNRPDYEVFVAGSGLEAVGLLAKNTFDLVILDMMLPDISGQEVMDYINQQQMTPDVIVNSGTNDIEVAIGALKRGAYAFLRKSCPRVEFINTIENAVRARRLKQDNLQIKRQLEYSERIYRHLIDNSPDIIFTLDTNGFFIFINDRVQPLLGWHKDEVLGQHYSLLVHPDDLERARYLLVRGGTGQRASRKIELRLKSRDPENDARLFSHEVMQISLPPNPGEAPTPSSKPHWGIYGIAQDMTEHRRADALIAHQAYHDILTDLPNRTLFKDRLGLALLQARRNQEGLAVLLIDLDRFKLINESQGHDMGDELLRQTASRLQGSLRACDTLARLGDDEFTVILPELNSAVETLEIVERCLSNIRLPFTLDGQVFRVTASMGVAMYPPHGQNAHDLLKSADIAMYHQKSNGRDGYAFFDDTMLGTTTRNILLERDLHQALDHGELEMYYQPQVDVRTQCITGAEALMRWNHPQRGLLGAGDFLPYAEENGLIIPMTDWMLEAICQDLQAWNKTATTMLRMSFNLSPQYLDRGDFFIKLRDTLARYNLSPAQFEVEVTENICIRNPLGAIGQLNQLCELGVSIAIDDFGTGYSSLSYLHRFPIHTLKIDRAFVMEIVDEATPLPVVLAIISIAKGLNLHLVAEGVETDVQKRYLAQAGCQTIQGYHYFRPMQQEKLLALLSAKV